MICNPDDTLKLVTLTEQKEQEWFNVHVIFRVNGDKYQALTYKCFEQPWTPCEDSSIHDYVESEWNNERTTVKPLALDDPLVVEAFIDNI